MRNDWYKIILSRLKSIGETQQATRDEVGRIDRDLGAYTENMENVLLRLSRVEDKMESLERQWRNHERKVEDRVGDALQPAVKQMNTLTKEIKNKKTIIVFKNGFIEWLKEKTKRIFNP